MRRSFARPAPSRCHGRGIRGDPRRDSEAAVDGLMEQPLGHLGQDDVGVHAIDQPVIDRGRPDEVD
jgi:hypothetical protein